MRVKKVKWANKYGRSKKKQTYSDDKAHTEPLKKKKKREIHRNRAKVRQIEIAK